MTNWGSSLCRLFTGGALRIRTWKARGFTMDDFEYFPVGTTRGLERRWNDYVIFPILDEGDTVGYVARHTWPKDEIDAHNRRAGRRGDYKILRYRNSTENDFVKPAV